MRLAALLLLCACSLTPIPDVTSNALEPCATERRECPLTFELKAGTEQSVELRGDFRDGGWVSGVPMEKVDGGWTASIAVGWDASVQYKFFIDGNRWILDPANTQSIPDGKGNTNSVVRNVTCEPWLCR